MFPEVEFPSPEFLQGISQCRPPSLFDYKATAFACFCKLFLMVLLGWFLLDWLGVKGLDFKVGIMLMACPTAFSSYLLSTKLGTDRSSMSSDIMVSTLLSMVTLSFWLWRLG